MSRRTRRSRREAPARVAARDAGPARRPGSPPPQRRVRAAVGLAALAIAVAAGFLTLRARHAVFPAAGTLDAMAPESAYFRGVALADSGRWRESLPYYRRGLAGQPGLAWEAHLNYANSLNNVTIDYTRRAGRSATLSRSSAERVEMGREAIAELERAARMAPDGQTRALVLTRLSNIQTLWGFRWETLNTLHDAAEADPSHPALAEREAVYRGMMRDPRGYVVVQSNIDGVLAPR